MLRPTITPGLPGVCFRTPPCTATVGTAPASPRSVVLTEEFMNAIIYLVGLVVVVMFILSLVGLR